MKLEHGKTQRDVLVRTCGCRKLEWKLEEERFITAEQRSSTICHFI